MTYYKPIRLGWNPSPYTLLSKHTTSQWLERTALMSYEPSVLGNISTAFLALSVGGNISRVSTVSYWYEAKRKP